MNCPICSGQCTLFGDTKQDISYYHCEVCQLIFKSPENYQSFSEQKRRYDLHQNGEESEGYRLYFKSFLDFVLPNTGRVQHALDFGCGASDLLAQMLRKEGIECEIYDPIYHPETSYLQSSFDLIVSVEVFEHLHHPRETFAVLLSRIKEGGYLAIRTQFHSNSRDEFLTWYYRLDPTHIIFFRPETFRYLCRLYGCSYIADNSLNMVLIQKNRHS